MAQKVSPDTESYTYRIDPVDETRYLSQIIL